MHLVFSNRRISAFILLRVRYGGRVGGIICVILLILCLAGCRHGGELTASGVTTIEFWNGFTGPDGKTMEKIVRRFNDSHKDPDGSGQAIQVRMQIIPWGTYYDKVTLSLAYGGAPDVFILHADRLPEYADVNAVITVDDLLKTGGLDPNDFAPRAWKAAQWKGRQYAIPLDCHPQALYYNTDLFKKAGIAHPPTNLSEFLADAKKLTKDTDGDGKIDQWGFAFTWLRNNAHTFLAQYDSGWMTSDGRHSDLTSANAREAFQLMSDIIYKYKVCPAPEGEDAWIGFRTSKVAMAIEGIYMLSSVEEQEGLKFAGAPCPVFGRHPGVWGNSHMMCMPRGISPEHRKAAWTFMKFLSDNSLDWAKGGQVPVRKSILATPEFRKLSVQYEFSKELPYVVYSPPSTSLNQILPFCDAAVEATLNKIKPMDEALAEAARRTNTVLERQ